MAAFLVGLLLLLAMAADRSDAAYCVCNTGLSDTALQKNIDFACGAGADCAQILQNGACYNPNTVKDHCNYAVNSYYQRRQATGATCDFQGTATLVPTSPNAGSSGCVYPSSASNAGSATPTTGGIPTTGGTNTGTAFPGGTMSPPGIGVAPSVNGFGTDNSSGGARLMPDQCSSHIVFLAMIFSLTALSMWPRF